MESLINNKSGFMHHIQDAAITILPSAAGTLAALELTNVGMKVLFGIGSLVWLYYRIAIIRKEYNKKTEL